MRVKFPFVLRTVHVLFRVTKRFSVEEGLNWRSRNALVAARVCQVACNCKIRDADIFIFQGLVILLSCLPSIFPTEARNQRVLHAKRTRLKFLHNGSIINDSRV